MCFGLDLIQVSSSEEEDEKLSALDNVLSFRGEPVRRLFGLPRSSCNSVSEEDPSSFVDAKPMADGPSFLYNKLVRESWYKKSISVS